MKHALKLRLPLFLALLILTTGLMHAASPPMIRVETWRIKPGGQQSHDYWIDGVVKNTSGQRLTDVYLVFDVETRKGKTLGEMKAAPKLTILLPQQECPFAAQVGVHDARMYKMILKEVTVGMVGESVVLNAIPFSSEKKSALFAGVRKEK